MSSKDRYVLEDRQGDTLIVSKLGDRMLDECPVEEGGECIDPNCDGAIGETERDEETYSAHELYCYGCGLNWVQRGGTWDEKYAEWPTSFASLGDTDE